MTAEGPASSAASDAALAATLLAIDPRGLGGAALRAGPGPAREAWIALARAGLPPGAPVRRAPLHIDDDRLLGGLDLASSLAAGRPVAQRGVLADCDGGLLLLPMAERIEPGVAARLSAALDNGEILVERDGFTARLPTRLAVVALDEGLSDEERPPSALLERLGFWIDAAALDASPATGPTASPEDCAAARLRLALVAAPSNAIIEALCAVAASVGVASLRAPLLALSAARAHAALAGRSEITPADAAVAARLVLAPRALYAPSEPTPDSADAPEPPPPEADAPPDREDAPRDPTDTPPAEMVIAAIRAALPDSLLEGLALGLGARARSARARGAGASAKSAKRGRPVGSRPGARRPGDRLNLVETLRAATPWQKLRGGVLGEGRVLVRREDFRVRRFVQRTESTTIFVVDASGSAAVHRLAEAKGAVELLLAKAYVTRARVALIAFRGAEAEILLPPTRSLTRARRRLADLPGGGGTPLAAGMEAALRLALVERTMDRTPLLVFLTDGRANIGLGGAPGRAAAEDDALAAAARVRAAGIPAAFVDTSPRPRPGGDRFALAMDAVYAPLPYLDSGAVAGVVDGLRAGGS